MTVKMAYRTPMGIALTLLTLGLPGLTNAAEGDDAVMTKFMLDRLEVRDADDSEKLGYWEGQVNIRTDYQGMAFKAKGERPEGGPTESAEYQLLYQRLVSDFFDAQFGIRYDNQPGPSRTYAVAGLQGLAPYFFEVDANLFLSDEGDMSARAEAEYDLLLTQRLILQPAAELNVAFSDDEELGIGSGFSSAELGLRLRYEVTRKIAPYIGVQWERKLGNTADYARDEGEDVESTAFTLGITAWF
ncbi:copper resistance protein B [Marinobacterium mangrovicola]|uniref:Copper resistance protein B n=1 Tax=Marinobacterium mangrovicola TaxID=1476959 RepID=A0A4R1G736_9GAMM|nr:copper resistance protein B [Marinobacterium mangrovicola]TCK02340.1 copper resistance protein B [Marinobacterium mangrovicola]